MPPVAITGWGSALPPTEVANHQLEPLFDTSDQWIVERSGIRTRHAADGPFIDPSPPSHPPGGSGTTAALAAEAGRRALDSAGASPSEIGMLFLCTTSPDQAVPATSSAVAGALGIHQGSVDLNAACSGFAYGLVLASTFLVTGPQKALVVGAETLTRLTNWEDRTTAFLFGDGAGAVVVERVDAPGSLLGWDLGVDGALVELMYADHGSGMKMKGQEIFRHAVRITVDSVKATLERAGVDVEDVALFIPHQANQRMMNAIADRLGISSENVASVISRTGNTSAASIPIALVDAVEAGRLAKGDLVLFAGFGAGMTWGSALWRWKR
jgi:3-oxoacyl-[acyl-carrier-protein] synthase III